MKDEDIGAAFLAALNLADGISKLTGIPYRPPWLQPIHDGWKHVNAMKGEISCLKKQLSSLQTELESLKNDRSKDPND